MRSPIKQLFVLAIMSSSFALGCELIVDFDRTKIVGEEVPETGATDATTTTDSSTSDAGSDGSTSNDAGSDSASDAADAATD